MRESIGVVFFDIFGSILFVFIVRFKMRVILECLGKLGLVKSFRDGFL